MMLTRGEKSKPSAYEAADPTPAAPEVGEPAVIQSGGDKPRAESKHSFGGWVRVDSDNVLRGWVTDRNNRSLRPLVDIFIDEEPVAALRADRLDPKLVELGEGDGCYAFAMLIPEQFRDGAPHSFEAVVRDGQFKLKSKLESFETPADAWLPWIELYSSGYGVARGCLHHGQYSKSISLELWRDGSRLDVPVETRWSGPVGDMSFTAVFPPDAHNGDATLIIAAPGMMEAALEGAHVNVELSLEAERDETGLLTVRLEGDIGWLEGHTVEVRVYLDGVAEPLVIDKPEAGGAFRLRLPPSAGSRAATVWLAVDGKEIPQLSAQPRRALGRLTRNGSFQIWDADGPAEWETPAAAVLERGFYAFPARVLETQGPSGDLVRLEFSEAGEEPRLLLRQTLSIRLDANDIVEAALLVRTSLPASMSLRVVNADGSILASASLSTRRPWAWGYAAELLQLQVPAASPTVELWIESSDAIAVDIAGLRLGGGAFAENAPTAETRQESRLNAVENASLVDWPRGIVLDCANGRVETARGWFVFNRRTSDPVKVKALLSDEESDRVGFMFAAEKVPDYCRLEVRLDHEMMSELGQGVLRFEVGAPLAARRLLSASTVAAPEYQLIDKIMILKRSQSPTPQGFTLTDETVATPGRKLLITRRFHTFELPVAVGSRKSSDFAWEEQEAESSDYFLVLEFRQPFAVALRDVRLEAGGVAAAPLANDFLSLEDRSIAAQAEQTRGLALWLSPTPVAPAGLMGGPQGDAPMMRWSWSESYAGTVEVVICVYNAIEETLACLRSLIGTTRVPHSVRIIDDGSEPYVTRRLESFVADKPWMQLVINPENIGYTRSADRGLRESEADWVILLNSDTVVTPGWIEGMLEVAAADPHVAFVGPLSNAATFQSVPDLYDARNQFKVNDLPPGWTAAQMAALVAKHSEKAFPEAPLLNGFCTLIRRSVFLEVGGLNAAAFPTGYGEENDLCTRVVKAGYKLAIADHVYVYHSKSASFGSTKRTELAKAGSKALKELHPDVDYGVLTGRFRDIPALVRLRAAIRGAFENTV